MSIKTVETMVSWIEDNIREAPTLDEMSSYVGYSPYYCSTKFHEVVGLRFKTYLNKRKLCHAILDLKESEERIIEIAFRYGFSSHEAFTRAFVREFGICPSKYRRELPEVRFLRKA